jgi:hypothetical protein
VAREKKSVDIEKIRRKQKKFCWMDFFFFYRKRKYHGGSTKTLHALDTRMSVIG